MPELDAYRKKRDFSKTPEPPPGDPDASARNLVFVVQQHAATRMHWDFRLEVDGVLKSWPLPKGPSIDPKEKRMAVMVEDHPYEYRTFEGVIPKGEYGGGQVIVWDEGIYTPDEGGATSWDDKEEGSHRMLEGIAAGKLSFTLQGHKLRGSFALVKTRYSADSWLLIKHRDEYAAERDILEEDRSVRSGLSIKDLKEGRLPNPGAASLEALPNARQTPFPEPRRLQPMLATLVDKAFDNTAWLWEPKLDGIRTLTFIRDGKVELRSRRGVDVTKAYPALAGALKAQAPANCVLDGEICALDEEGVPRFQLLQPRINLTRPADIARVEAEIPVAYFLFDLLYLDGYDLKAVPIRDRKNLLQTRIVQRDNVRIVSHIEEQGREVEAAARRIGFEGVVGKRADSRYEPGARSRAWVKVKAVQEQEFVVGGYTRGEGSRAKSFGALAIGYYDDAGLLHHTGNVGSGFDDRSLGVVLEKLMSLETDEPPFAEKKIEGKPAWVKPELVAQVKFAEWTKDGHLRAPVFLGLRNDIDPRQVRREQASPAAEVTAGPIEDATVDHEGVGAQHAAPLRPVGTTSPLDSDVAFVLRQLENPKQTFPLDIAGESIKVTNLDKEFWPAYKDRPPLLKRDLIRYYASVAPYILPHLKDRPLTLTRYPNGVTAKPFYQKHYEQPIPSFVETVNLWSESNKEDGEYILCNNLPTLVWLAQIADLEIHAWMSRIDPEPDAHGRTMTFSGSEAAIDASALSYPDYMIFDLDPYIYSGQEGKGEEPEYNKRGWQKTVEIALSLKDLLDGLKLSSFVKTSGKTGLHIYVPVLRHFDYDHIRAFTATIGHFLLQQHPKDLTMDWDTSKRRGKVFFDHNQNTRGKTLAAQYSLRPTGWAGVSMPVAWPELSRLDPTDYNLLTIPDLLRGHGDPWADILSHKNDLRGILTVPHGDS
ncbi:MAG: ATP-dependent DNA ligase [Dehalococcoidia bacterium]|nr:ATP-dependent DNA ligase [Dehalococcoidia bacterium]